METVVRRSTCNRDCPDACGLEADIRNGEIVALRGDPRHPVTRGFVCSRTSQFARLHRGPGRNTEPLLRRGGELVPVTLDEALDYVAERLTAIRAESGPAAIFHYRSGGSLGLLKSVADRFFEDFGPCTGKIGDICNGAGEAAQVADFGKSDSNDLFDLLHSRHIVVWGKNPFVSNVHLVPVLHDAKARGATITLVDPVHHKGATLADEYLQPRPGGDIALALGVARVLFDRGATDPRGCANFEQFAALVRTRSAPDWALAAGVDRAALERLAAHFAAGPTAILVGWGMQRRGHGAAIIRAIDALSAISGNLFVRGGGASFYFARRGPFAKLSTGCAARHVREPMFAADVLAAQDPPIRAIWVTAGNPMAMLPDSAAVERALAHCELVVVVDPFLTDTARRADVVLPCPTLFEDDDLIGAYGHHWIAESRPLVEPPPGIVQEVELFRRLAERTGLGERFAHSVDDWKRALLAPLARDGITLERLRAEGALRPPSVPELVFADGTVDTPSRRVELMTELPGAALADPTPAADDFPLWLFSNSVRDAQASYWSRDPGERMTVTVHPTTATAAGVAVGQRARLVSELGALEVDVVTDELQRQDVAIVPKGGHYDRGQSINALIAARPTDLGLGAAYLDQRVRLEPLTA